MAYLVAGQIQARLGLYALYDFLDLFAFELAGGWVECVVLDSP